MAKYINPFTDWGFKRLFGQEFSKDLLISFLNDLLEGELHVKDVVFKDKEQLPQTKDQRGIIYDVSAKPTQASDSSWKCRTSGNPIFWIAPSAMPAEVFWNR